MSVRNSIVVSEGGKLGTGEDNYARPRWYGNSVDRWVALRCGTRVSAYQ